MDLSYEDGLAATCPRFVRLRILELQRRTDTRYVYYLIDSKNTEIRVAGAISYDTAAISYDNAALKYIAGTEFVKKYSSLYELKDMFEWDVADEFKTWIESILAQKPKFIHPYHRSSKYLMVDEDIPTIDYKQSCWFSHIIPLIHENLIVQVPYAMNSYLLAPDEAVAMIHSGSRVWYVKIDNSRFTTGWMNVVHAHNIGKNYLLLFACVGHLEFDLFVFNEDNDEIAYDWTTIAPIQHSNAPNDWDSRKAFTRLTGDVIITTCPPISYRATRHAFRSAILIKSDILQKLKLTERLNGFCQQTGQKEITLVIRGAQWPVQYDGAYLHGQIWETLVAAYNLRTNHILILSPDIKLRFHIMVLHVNDREEIYDWYAIPYDEEPFDLQTHLVTDTY